MAEVTLAADSILTFKGWRIEMSARPKPFERGCHGEGLCMASVPVQEWKAAAKAEK